MSAARGKKGKTARAQQRALRERASARARRGGVSTRLSNNVNNID
jgi:hypothetical protein